MNYEDYNDYELIHLICEQDDEAKDLLFAKYKYIIDILIKKYKYVAKKLGIELIDLEQEAMVGFTDAINNYTEDKNAILATFITLCVERRIRKILLKYGRIKNQVLSDSLSLDYVYDDYDVTLAEVISDNYANDPLRNIENDENYAELIEEIKKVLSESELVVFSLMVKHLNYNEIALILNKNAKQIDNTIQRIKSKVKKIIKSEEEMN